jgi:hypothetical protein
MELDSVIGIVTRQCATHTDVQFIAWARDFFLPNIQTVQIVECEMGMYPFLAFLFLAC